MTDYFVGGEFSMPAFRAAVPEPDRAEISRQLWAAEGAIELDAGAVYTLKSFEGIAEKLHMTFTQEQIAEGARCTLAQVEAWQAGKAYVQGKLHPNAERVYRPQYDAWQHTLAHALVDGYAPGVCHTEADVATFADAVAEFHECYGQDCCEDYWAHWSRTAKKVAELLVYFQRRPQEAQV